MTKRHIDKQRDNTTTRTENTITTRTFNPSAKPYARSEATKGEIQQQTNIQS